MRPTRDEWAMMVVRDTAKRSTCLRRNVGCVLLNSRGHILSTGYNGVAAGLPHCNEGSARIIRYGLGKPRLDGLNYTNACPGATAASGTALDACLAIHAEQNALLQCQDVWEIYTCYSSVSPCISCIKLLLNTSCQEVVFDEEYPHPEAKHLWVTVANRTWEKFDGHR